jgi:hypothetical protein
MSAQPHIFLLFTAGFQLLLPKSRLNLALQELVDRTKFDAEGHEVGVGHGRRGVEAAVLGVCSILSARQKEPDCGI